MVLVTSTNEKNKHKVHKKRKKTGNKTLNNKHKVHQKIEKTNPIGHNFSSWLNNF